VSESTFIIAEIGINHNGDMDIAKKLIDGAVTAGADAVKFQKREVSKVYTPEVLDAPRESPWGSTQREQKEGLEFGKLEYDEIDRYCKANEIEWFASAWDLDSQIFLRQYDSKYNKVASAMLTAFPLLELIAEEKKYTFISTGMHDLEEIDKVVELFKAADCPFEIMHCNSQYPMPTEVANLKVINTLRERYGCKVGYSGHESGLVVSSTAVALGATSIERHITLDRAMYGSDQSASVELGGFGRLVDYIRTTEAALGDGVKRVSEIEREVRSKLEPIPSALE
jgi:N-acetylneuraminate synthase